VDLLRLRWASGGHRRAEATKLRFELASEKECGMEPKTQERHLGESLDRRGLSAPERRLNLK
jgi:hypothetical protein